jgi:hypothetical protein
MSLQPELLGTTSLIKTILLCSATAKQRNGESVADFRTRVENIIESFSTVNLDKPSAQTQARRLLEGLDDNKFASMKTYYANELMNGRDVYPTDIDDAANKATKWLTTSAISSPVSTSTSTFQTFYQGAKKCPPKRSNKQNNKPSEKTQVAAPDGRVVEGREIERNKAHQFSMVISLVMMTYHLHP